MEGIQLRPTVVLMCPAMTWSIVIMGQTGLCGSVTMGQASRPRLRRDLLHVTTLTHTVGATRAMGLGMWSPRWRLLVARGLHLPAVVVAVVAVPGR